MNVVIRTTGDPALMTTQVRQTMLELDSFQPPHSIVVMDDLISDSIARERFAMTWLSVLAAIALVLASVGIYSVLSHVTVQRTREVGIRLALGAQTSDVVKLVVRNGLTLAVIGVAMGLAATLALTRVMGSLLVGVTPSDAMTFTGVSVLLIVVGLLASYVPARRATKVDPLVALKSE